MNEARQIYLGTYSLIDSIYHLIKTFRMEYKCWKYGHSLIINAMSLSMFVDYNMYLEVAEGELDQTWKDNNIVDFCTFRYVI